MMRKSCVALVLLGLSLGLINVSAAADVDLRTPDRVRWATVLCRFADTETLPHPKSYYEDVMSTEAPGLQHYWNDVSYGRITFESSPTYGWYTLPRGKAYYNKNEPWEVPERALADCLRQADRRLDMRQFFGLNLWFSGALANRGWGVRRTYDFDGRRKTYGVTIMSEPATWTNDSSTPQGILAHEMGHGFGLQHTAGEFRNEFSSYWDLMSSIGTGCQRNDPDFSCLPVHPSAFQKRRLGWIQDDQVVTVRPGSARTFLLEPLSEASLEGLLMAKVPLHGAIPGYFTVELRTPTGYDEHTLGEAAIIHRWDPTQTQATGDHPYVIGRTYANGAVDWTGEMWQPGETYTHARTGIEIAFLSRLEDGRFEVRITSP